MGQQTIKAVGKIMLKDNKTASEHIDTRKSKELVIGFCGAIGSGVNSIAHMVSTDLEKTYNYKCIPIKVSKIIEEISNTANYDSTYDRFNQLQDNGNSIRAARTTKLAEYVIAQIRSIKGVDSNSQPTMENKRRAFIIDQLKHPDEVKLLKKVYGNSFYLFGVLSTENERMQRLTKVDEIPAPEATQLLDRDENDSVPHGQKVRKTLQYADFFLRHSRHRHTECEKSAKRFISLMLAMPIVTPSVDEYAMYEAYTASLRSSCLSRQVGASIIDSNNHLISTGYNDVPSAGGGLYGSLSSCHTSGERCFEKESKICHNDYHKNKIYTVISDIVNAKVELNNEQKSILIKSLKESRVRNLLEFSRSIHAEMEAILAAGRKGKPVVGGRLFCTTFPCHNCARHIIAAGINEVYFIEPYEKSLALDLHDDAMTLEEHSTDHVKLIPFEGVAPSKFSELFRMKSERKEEGKMVEVSCVEAVPQIEKYLDGEVDYESLMIKYLNEENSNDVQKVIKIAPK